LRAPTIATALGDQQRRRVLELGEQSRVQPLPQRYEPRAELFDACNLAFGVSAAPQHRRPAAAATRKVGHGLKCRCSAAEANDQLAKRDWPDAGSAQQPQAVD
jgi:hypothetical protein